MRRKILVQLEGIGISKTSYSVEASEQMQAAIKAVWMTGFIDRGLWKPTGSSESFAVRSITVRLMKIKKEKK